MSAANQRATTSQHDDIAVISDETSRLNNDSSNNGVTSSSAASTSADQRKQHSVHIQEPAVSDMRGYEVVKVVEKHGQFHSAIPVMPLPIAVLFCLLNIVAPGTGE